MDSIPGKLSPDSDFHMTGFFTGLVFNDDLNIAAPGFHSHSGPLSIYSAQPRVLLKQALG